MSVLWSADLGNGPIDTTPAVADGLVFVSTGGVFNWSSMSYERPPHLYALDAESGRVVWRTETSAAGWQVSSPALASGRVFLGTTDGKLLCFSERTGELLWSFSAGSSPTGVTSSPLAVGDTVYAASGDGKIYALSLEGRELWSAELGGPAYMASPALYEGRIIAGSDAGALLCLEPNGTEAWNFSAEGKIRASPVVAGERVYFVSTVYEGWAAVRGFLYCLDARTGRSLWPSPVRLPPSTSGPAAHGGHIFLGTGEGATAVDSEGRAVWEARTSGPVQSSITTDGRTLYICENTGNGTLRALHLTTGAELWSFTPEPRQYLLSSPALADGRIYFGSDNGKVYCIGPGTGSGGGGQEAAEWPWEKGTLALLAAGSALILAALASLLLVRRIRRREDSNGGGRQN